MAPPSAYGVPATVGVMLVQFPPPKLQRSVGTGVLDPDSTPPNNSNDFATGEYAIAGAVRALG
ncbi:MAG: hypothetical protein ACHQ16_02325 [Candidatus Lutacidiplasmatales archaeon]